MSAAENLVRNVSELQAVAEIMDGKQLEQAVQICLKAKRIFFSGMGRSGNMVKALAIRFMHLGYDAYVAGDAATPSVEESDLLIAVTASAKTKVTLNHMEVARRVGARVLLVSALPENPGISDYFLSVPAKTKVKSAQHAGSLFEQSVLVVGDAICEELKQEKKVSTEYMDHRHANLQ